MTSADARPAVRTYGGWRRARGIGLFGVGAAGTVVVLSCVVVPLLLASLSLRLGATAIPPAVFVAAVTLTRVGDLTLAQLVTRRVRWHWSVRTGRTRYRAPVVTQHPGALELPGVLAPTRLLSVPDGRGGAFGLMWNRRTGHLTAILRVAATSMWLVDQADADGWVSNWHSWLASLGYLPMVRTVAVTVETAPEPGTTLRDAVQLRLAPDAPADVRRLMDELVACSPAAAAHVDTRVSITFDPAALTPRIKNLDAAAEEVSRQLTGLESSLNTCGVTVLGRASAAEVAGMVRIAYDPASRGDVERALTTPSAGQPEAMDWADAAPVATEEHWDHYRHDSGISTSWVWRDAPRQQVPSTVLARLLSPGRFVKRVTLLYRPLPAGEAARILEGQVNAAAFRDAYRRAQHRDESARDLADRHHAEQAAAEEAQGAGVVQLTLLVTTTVTDPADLPAAIADLEARADQSKIRLTRAWATQGEAFDTTIP